MAKKTIISDFSALKGKVSFSERGSDVKMSPQVIPAPAQKHEVAEDGLKVGQSVVLMDSILRGIDEALAKYNKFIKMSR